MQNKYAGDIGDFGKFGLLRYLLKGTDLSLAVNWYLFTDENNNDGNNTHYLKKNKFEQFDPDLFFHLSEILENVRSVSALEQAGILASTTKYFSENVDFYRQYPDQNKAHKEMRLSLRKDWQKRALSKLADSDVLFLDPDIGLEIESCKSLSQKKAGKYVFFDEIAMFHEDKALTIIYHHLNRHKKHGSHSEQIFDRATQLKCRIKNLESVIGLRFKPYSPRAFFLLCDKSVDKEIKSKIGNFKESRWSELWDNFLIV